MVRPDGSPRIQANRAGLRRWGRLWTTGGALVLVFIFMAGPDSGCESHEVSEGDFSASSPMGAVPQLTQDPPPIQPPKQPSQLPAPLIWIGNGVTAIFSPFFPKPEPAPQISKGFTGDAVEYTSEGTQYKVHYENGEVESRQELGPPASDSASQ